MEITMKKTGLILALALLSAALQAQEIPYALPATSVTVKVDVRQESFFAGPYAAYAKHMLNMSVEDRDRISTEITRVELLPCVEADTGAWYTCDAESAALMALGAQGLVSLCLQGTYTPCACGAFVHRETSPVFRRDRQ